MRPKKTLIALFLAFFAALVLIACGGDRGYVWELDAHAANFGLLFDYESSWQCRTEVGRTVIVIGDGFQTIDAVSFLYGQGASVEDAKEAAWNTDGIENLEVTRSWSDNGIDYQTGIQRGENTTSYLLSGNEPSSGRGFLLDLNLNNELWSAEKGQALFDAIIETLEFHPNKVGVDYPEYTFGPAEDSGGEEQPVEEGSEAEPTSTTNSEPETEPNHVPDKRDVSNALLVAVTNAWADDVFAADGNTYDAALFHSYGENRGSHLRQTVPGVVSERDENVWSVTALSADAYIDDTPTGYTYSISGTVTYDGENFIISDVQVRYKLTDAPSSSYEDFPLMAGNGDQAFVVTPELLGNR